MRGYHCGHRRVRATSLADATLFLQGPLHSPLDSSRSTRHHGLVERVQRDPRRMVSPLRRYPRHISFWRLERLQAGSVAGSRKKGTFGLVWFCLSLGAIIFPGSLPRDWWAHVSLLSPVTGAALLRLCPCLCLPLSVLPSTCSVLPGVLCSALSPRRGAFPPIHLTPPLLVLRFQSQTPSPPVLTPLGPAQVSLTSFQLH